jgi:predicted TIM-barrel fold metal-dependent hydrolase
MRLPFVCACAAAFLSTSLIDAQAAVDPKLAAEIAGIKAIDNHAHPVRATGQGPKDDEYDALPVETMTPFSEPVRLRTGSPDTIAAWRALWGYPYNDRAPNHIAELAATRKGIQREQGERYPAWALDRMGVETMLANRVAMGPTVDRPRFLWVSFVDALMLPLKNDALAARNADAQAFFADEERLLARYLRECSATALPATLDEYLNNVVTKTLERQKAGGAVAVKFEAAYLRPLDFANPTKAEAARVYTRFREAAPPAAEYKILQDYLFRHIATQAGRLGLAVHLHVAAGAGGYFEVAGANPLLLEPVLNDPTLRRTNFVFIHGGWPFTREIAALLTKPNAYVDFSEQTLLLYPRAVSQTIREWLEYVPEKIMFATDAYPYSEELGWEESGWLAARSGREALGLALTGMLNDGEITRARASELARMVLRENAAKLYGLAR